MAHLIDISAAARILGIQPSALEAWSDSGVGPLPVGRCYDAEQVQAWIAEATFARNQVDGSEPPQVEPSLPQVRSDGRE